MTYVEYQEWLESSLDRQTLATKAIATRGALKFFSEQTGVVWWTPKPFLNLSITVDAFAKRNNAEVIYRGVTACQIRFKDESLIWMHSYKVENGVSLVRE